MFSLYFLSLFFMLQPITEPCNKITLINAHTKEFFSECLVRWERVEVFKYNVVCVVTDHGHEHLFYVDKNNSALIYVPVVDKKLLICEGA